MKKICIGLLAFGMALLSGGGAQAAGSGDGTQHFGPFASSSTDGSSCGTPWANDTFNRSFSVHDNGDGTFKVTEKFTDGTFVTNGTTSPGACETSNHHGSTVTAGVTGNFHGFLSGTVTSTRFNPSGCASAGQCSTLVGFIGSVFGPTASFTCLSGFEGCDFNFEYNSSDQSLAFHHWQDKSSHDGEQFIGDIATA